MHEIYNVQILANYKRRSIYQHRSDLLIWINHSIWWAFRPSALKWTDPYDTNRHFQTFFEQRFFEHNQLYEIMHTWPWQHFAAAFYELAIRIVYLLCWQGKVFLTMVDTDFNVVFSNNCRSRLTSDKRSNFSFPSDSRSLAKHLFILMYRSIKYSLSASNG